MTWAASEWRGTLREAAKRDRWLATIVRNEAFRRRPRRRPDPSASLEELEGAEDVRVIATVERADLRAALGGLPARDRELLAMRYAEDLTQAAIARRLGIPEGTVKVRLHRARARLRSAYGQLQAPAPGGRLYTRASGAGESSDRWIRPARATGSTIRYMKTAPRQIVAFGGGGFSMESGNPLLDDYVLGLTKAERPRVCFLPSASGDADHYIVRFYRAFSSHRCEASHISLFRREQGPEDLRRHLLSQDLIYVGGGSVVSLLGVWKAHGIDEILREAWEAGIILCGLSAGSLCWFAEAVTGFHGAPKRLDGLGLLPFSNCVHYERGSSRRDSYHGFLREGMRPGYAAEDGAALHFTGEELSRVVASRPEARGYRLDVSGQRVVEMRIATTYLGEPGVIPAAPTPEALSTAVAAA